MFMSFNPKQNAIILCTNYIVYEEKYINSNSVFRSLKVIYKKLSDKG
jgi:hypothetical protein